MAQFSMEIMRLTGSVLRGNQHVGSLSLCFPQASLTIRRDTRTTGASALPPSAFLDLCWVSRRMAMTLSGRHRKPTSTPQIQALQPFLGS